MKQPTAAQLKDPTWWDVNAPEGAERVHVTGLWVLFLKRFDLPGGTGIRFWSDLSKQWMPHFSDYVGMARWYEAKPRPTDPRADAPPGAPPGADCYFPENDEWEETWGMHLGAGSFFVWDEDEEAWTSARDLRRNGDFYERIIWRPKAVEPRCGVWDNDRPPIGTECKVKTAGDDHSGWQMVRVVAYSHGKVWLQQVGGEVCVDDWVTAIDSVVFRPTTEMSLDQVIEMAWLDAPHTDVVSSIRDAILERFDVKEKTHD